MAVTRTQELRIENIGDVAAGVTSTYHPVPGGIYRYAAYEYELAGAVVSQFVTDWMGETPLQGEQFTYRVSLDTTKVRGAQATLVEVVMRSRTT
jgi:hypothetical protein